MIVPAARIDRYRKENQDESQASDKACAEYLAQEIVLPAVAKAQNIEGMRGLPLSDCNALSDRPQVTKSRAADFRHDDMQGWIL